MSTSINNNDRKSDIELSITNDIGDVFWSMTEENITIPEEVENNVYVAGASLKDGKLLTNGGRVLGVTAVEDNLKDAIKASYSLVKQISFDNAFYRNDIGAKALAVLED